MKIKVACKSSQLKPSCWDHRLYVNWFCIERNCEIDIGHSIVAGGIGKQRKMSLLFKNSAETIMFTGVIAMRGRKIAILGKGIYIGTKQTVMQTAVLIWRREQRGELGNYERKGLIFK